jgi:histidinol-phosphate aminotransferase
VIAERDRLTTAVRKLVPDVPDSQANFVWLPLGERSVDFAKGCESRGVIVRPFAGEGVRVTVGTPAENDAFLAAAESALT